MTSPVEESFTDTSKSKRHSLQVFFGLAFPVCSLIGITPCVLGYDRGMGPLILVGLALGLFRPTIGDTSVSAHVREIPKIVGLAAVPLALGPVTAAKNNLVSTVVQISIGALILLGLMIVWWRSPARGVTQ